MKLMQVFNYCEYQNNMPNMFGDIDTTLLVAGDDGAGNDTYYNWYPSRAEEYDGAKQEAAVLFNAWLIGQGMKIDWDDEYFHVLIYISW